jgi:hypothetical protein
MDRRHTQAWGRSLVFAVLSTLAVCGYLGVRRAYLPDLGGAYASFLPLMRSADLPRNFFTFMRSTVVLPLQLLPSGWRELNHIPVQSLGACILAAVAVAGLVNSVNARWAALAFVTCLVPVLWAGGGGPSTGGGRFLYLPGVWLALVLAYGCSWAIAQYTNGRRLPRAAVACGLLVGLVYMMASVAYQQQLWAAASRISRQVMARWPGELMQGSGPIWISNLPSRCIEGPYILKPYSFRYYLGSLRPIRARTVVVSCLGGQFPAGPDSSSEQRAPGDAVVTLSWSSSTTPHRLQ